MKNLSFRRMTDLLSVVQPEKRLALKKAIQSGQIILVSGETSESKALKQKLKEYLVPYKLKQEVYAFPEHIGMRREEPRE